MKETIIDTQLIYALARINKLAELEEVISVPNVVKIDQVADRCYDESLFEAAKLLYMNINNNAKLALCYINLTQYREAVDAATKANSITTWKEVNLACLRAEEFRLANICGLHIIVHPDHLEELIMHYEKAGRSAELMQLMEQGLGLDNAHSGTCMCCCLYYLCYATCCVVAALSCSTVLHQNVPFLDLYLSLTFPFPSRFR